MSSNRKPADMVVEFEQEYDSAFALTVKAAETTATDGWQSMYTAFLESNQAARNYEATALERLAEQLKHGLLDTDERKELKKRATEAANACDSADQFDCSTVAPIRKTVEDLAKIVADYENKAASATRQTPLLDSNLEGRMAEAISMKPRASWNPRVGCVILSGVKV